jgi:group II intron reverse transcriptase/maturase
MRNADTILGIHQKRGSARLPLERVYKQLFNPELYLGAYGKIYRNTGAMTPGSTNETVDSMSLQKIQRIIDLLRQERYRWTSVRRMEIPKANGKMRPLGIPTWSDKLVQEVLRMLLEPYYEQRFSDHSHGFRPKRGCHTALREIQRNWKGTVWFIEGDIKGCFDNIDHTILLETIRRDIHDGRLLNLLDGLLKAGYMENWQYHDTLSGTPQGGIISPLLSNIYLNELDRFIEDTLTPAYTKGERRLANPEYERLSYLIRIARQDNDGETVLNLKRERRKLASQDPFDPDYRRLKFVRYADDFLLGFVGPKTEAEDIRQRLEEFLAQNLKLTLSLEKTLITHALDDKAKFLGYEITVSRNNNLIAANGKRAANGVIALLMPSTVVKKYRSRYSKNGKIIHRPELLANDDYTIVQQYQSVLRGIYNYYCMAVNVGNKRRMGCIWWVLHTSLAKTLAHKHKCPVSEIYRQYRICTPEHTILRVQIDRPGKKPLVAEFGGFSCKRIPEGLGTADFQFDQAWNFYSSRRSEVVQRLINSVCELCGASDEPIVVHHIHKLADINRPGRSPKENWEVIMSARKRKTLVVCTKCHKSIHAGAYNGRSL